MSFAEKLLQSGSVPIHYVIGKDKTGRECYYIIVCAKHKLEFMLSGGDVVMPEEYGHVVASGFGKRPPQDVINMLKKKYQFNIDA